VPFVDINCPLSLRERARVRGQSWIYMAQLPPHPAFGHLLPQGEGIGGRSVLIRTIFEPRSKFKIFGISVDTLCLRGVKKRLF
jgi:hypothetical protein